MESISLSWNAFCLFFKGYELGDKAVEFLVGPKRSGAKKIN